jgi:hypothetical protein
MHSKMDEPKKLKPLIIRNGGSTRGRQDSRGLFGWLTSHWSLKLNATALPSTNDLSSSLNNEPSLSLTNEPNRDQDQVCVEVERPSLDSWLAQARPTESQPYHP